MPYIIGFVKPVQIADSERYINDCCIGGDIVLDWLLPTLRERYGGDLQSSQEDWGWFVWFEQSGVKLAVDVHTDDSKRGEFRLHLTSRKPRFLLGAKIQDAPELEQLRDLVLSRLQSWPVERFNIEQVDEKYMPI
ncbi:MAG: hypothetical protein FWF20_04550 [Betaproteobacteria bacterium]|nr:hypothetical protein [Betaproteobacteria bacterium]MCL2886048.1 hypothetical protein [Betaproteobacteria bacterium]